MCHSIKCPGGKAPDMATDPEGYWAWYEKYGNGDPEPTKPQGLTLAQQFGFCSPKRQDKKRTNEVNK